MSVPTPNPSPWEVWEPKPFPRDPYLDEVDRLRRELDKYKAIVKQQAFEIEMRGDWGGTQTTDQIDTKARKFALQQAAEHLMDHGVIITGQELEMVCNEILKLKVTDDPRIKAKKK
jgi:uncharacterized protein YfeS